MASHSPQVAPTTMSREHQIIQKIFEKLGAFFGARKMWCNNTTLATQVTTATPRKPHINYSLFLKTPAKPRFATRKKNHQNALRNHKQIEIIHLLQSANP
jgi:hypothetical protein